MYSRGLGASDSELFAIRVTLKHWQTQGVQISNRGLGREQFVCYLQHRTLGYRTTENVVSITEQNVRNTIIIVLRDYNRLNIL